MGRLTEDMTRLVAEINTERSDRGRLMQEMRHSTAEMKRAVAHMKTRFHAAHKQMAREQRHSLKGFTSNLQNTVAGLRTAFSTDLAGARAAFFGSGIGHASHGHSRRAAAVHH
jgi:hypothetical protein